MYPPPSDLVDLTLAPVALLVERRLEEFGSMSGKQLALQIAYDSDREGATTEQRARDVVTAVTRLLHMGGWQASWDDRGVRLKHGHHSVVLGVSANLRGYVAGTAQG